jgi:hypothetical protein
LDCLLTSPADPANVTADVAIPRAKPGALSQALQTVMASAPEAAPVLASCATVLDPEEGHKVRTLPKVLLKP